MKVWYFRKMKGRRVPFVPRRIHPSAECVGLTLTSDNPPRKHEQKASLVFVVVPLGEVRKKMRECVSTAYAFVWNAWDVWKKNVFLLFGFPDGYYYWSSMEQHLREDVYRRRHIRCSLKGIGPMGLWKFLIQHTMLLLLGLRSYFTIIGVGIIIKTATADANIDMVVSWWPLDMNIKK